MGKDALVKYLELRDIMKSSIQFIEKEGNQLLDEAITHLNNQEILNSEDIKYSIKESYFKWIIDHCKGFSSEFNEEYRVNLNPNSSYIYTEILLAIINILPNINESKEVQENLEDHFNYLLKNL